MHDPLYRIRRLKTIIICLVLSVIGVGLMVLARVLDGQSGLTWLAFLPWNELGAILFGSGLLGIGLDAYFRQDNEELAERQLRRVLADHAPAIRDAVIQGFAFDTTDLQRVATPETLDRIIRNSLALRLGDADFAGELYEEIRDQAVRAHERWLDVKVSIRLSMLRAATAGSTPAYISTVRWEYTAVPTHQTRSFVVVNDRQEYRELAQDPTGASIWYLSPKNGYDAGSPNSFELVQFSLDGEARPIRRTARKGGQTYSVNLSQDVVSGGKPVSISYTYRTLASRDGHLLHVDVEQPTRGLSVEMDYSDTDIAYVNLLDFIASTKKSRIVQTPSSVPGKSIGVEFDGWLMPRSGVAFVWVLGEDSDV